MLLVVSEQNPTSFTKVHSDNFVSLNIWERRHIQEWIRQAPDVLGEELLVVSMEFDRFKNSGDRLDILALDRKGNLVVIELKRDILAGYADLQAIRYAAMVSSMTIERLLPYFVTYQQKVLNREEANSETALAEIKEFITDADNFEDLSKKPRIILCSEDFSTELTTTVLWLNQNGLDISCVRIKPHKVGDQIVIVPTRIIPLEEAKQYLIEIQHKEEIQQQTRRNKKKPATMTILVKYGRLKAGDKIYLKRYLPSHLSFDINNPIYIAEITGKLGQQDNVRWLNDSQEYSISNLTHTIFQSYHPTNKHPGPIQGGVYWQTEEGDTLTTLAAEVWAAQNV